MRVLIDTNIFIHRESDRIVPENLQKSLRILNKLRVDILVHPKSVEEIKRDSNEDRKKVALSKISIYPLLESPPEQNKDNDFLNFLGHHSKPQTVDNTLLYAVYKDAVDFLITEDKGIHTKAVRLDIKDRVLSIDDTLKTFEKDFHVGKVSHPPALKEELVYNLKIKDPFFDSLKEEYSKSKFEAWFKNISRDGRKCWVYFKEDGGIGALLIYKIENEAIDSTPSLSKKERFKLCTFKVSETARGQKIGELFIKLSVEYAIRNRLSEIYLTCFTEKNNFLVNLITEYGFYKVARNRMGEDIFIKELLLDKEKLKSLSSLDVSKKFWPNFYDGKRVRKFIVPIRPEYHNKLFIEYEGRQTQLLEYSSGFIIEGNTIKKAYLCHSRITKISPGDILLFYRSQDKRELTSLGAVERVHSRLRDKGKIMGLVRKRTVYSYGEIGEMAKKPTMVILFTLHFYLTKPLRFDELKRMKILTAPPQSIVQVSHEQYLKIKNGGGIDERFTIG